jgi:hypothetical protein
MANPPTMKMAMKTVSPAGPAASGVSHPLRPFVMQDAPASPAAGLSQAFTCWSNVEERPGGLARFVSQQTVMLTTSVHGWMLQRTQRRAATYWLSWHGLYM